MSRFDSMISKGINTNDADATAADILEGKTAYVAGSKITGTLVPGGGGSGDYSELGETLDVEAETTISKGSRIVARENSLAGSKTTSYTLYDFAGSNIRSVSYDKSVLVYSESTYIRENTVLTFYFLSEETGLYDSFYDVTITGLPSYFASGNYLNNKICLSDDGTIGFSSYTNGSANGVYNTCSIKFVIDKENKTVSYSYLNYINDYVIIPTDNTHYKKIVGLNVYGAGDSTNETTGGYIVKYDGDYYLICKGGSYRYNVSDDSRVSEGIKTSMIVLKITTNGFTLKYYDTADSSALSTFGALGKVYGDGFYFTNPSNRRIIEFSFLTNSWRRSTSSYDASIYGVIYTDNLYVVGTTVTNNHLIIKRYQINVSDLTLSLVDETDFGSYTYSVYNCLLSSNGALGYFPEYGIFLDFNSGTIIYRYVSGSVVDNSYNFYYCKFDNTILNKYGIYAVIPTTNAQYLVSTSTEDCTTADRIYGIASQNLAVGTRGTARGLFSTMT